MDVQSGAAQPRSHYGGKVGEPGGYTVPYLLARKAAESIAYVK